MPTTDLCKKAGFDAYIPYLGDSQELIGEVIGQGKGVAFLSRSAYEWHFKHMLCYACIQIRSTPSWFALLVLIVTVAYSAVILLLVWRRAPRTFRVK
jgi:hypothetical protein